MGKTKRSKSKKSKSKKKEKDSKRTKSSKKRKSKKSRNSKDNEDNASEEVPQPKVDIKKKLKEEMDQQEQLRLQRIRNKSMYLDKVTINSQDNVGTL